MKKILCAPLTKIIITVMILGVSFFGLFRFSTLAPEFGILDYVETANDRMKSEIYGIFGELFLRINTSREQTSDSEAVYDNEYGEFTFSLMKNYKVYAESNGGEITNMTEDEKQQVTDMLNMLNNPQIYEDRFFNNYLENSGVVLSHQYGELSIYHNYDSGYYFQTVPDENFKICIAPTPAYLSECREEAEAERAKYVYALDTIQRELSLLIFCAIIIFILSVCLCVTCGRNGKDEKLHMLAIDRIYIEIIIAAAVIIFFLSLLSMIFIADVLMEYSYTFLSLLFAVIGTAGGGALIGLLLSAIRSIKNHSLYQRCALLRSGVWIINAFRKKLSKKSDRLAAAVVIIYCFLMILFSSAIIECIISLIFVLVVTKTLVGFDELKKGIAELGNGNISYKINNTDKGTIGELCCAVDKIGDGMSVAVEKQLRAERMKTQLITNVSHDLKTPLTSIINYSELLTEMNLSPSEANDYIKIIETKAMKLKTLTADLFEISKIQSGNEILKEESINLSLLIAQSLGELDKEIAASELEFKTQLDEECIVTGDGEKLSRVFENLFINAIKYSMKNTRVYVRLTKKSSGAVCEIKNISAYPLDFNAEEITERFVRGDESRSTDGNGLGLAIAKSYTEAMGGNFSILTDGDLFKVIIEF